MHRLHDHFAMTQYVNHLCSYNKLLAYSKISESDDLNIYIYKHYRIWKTSIRAIRTSFFAINERQFCLRVKALCICFCVFHRATVCGKNIEYKT